MNVSGFSVGSNPAYKGINTNSKQYKAAAKDYLANHRAEVAKMSPQERQMYELFGGEQAYMRNRKRSCQWRHDKKVIRVP